MSEEQTNDEVQTEQKELSPIEQKAQELGWRPKEEFVGDEEDFVDAKEFVQRQSLYDRISSQNKRLKGMEQALNALKTHHERVRETEYNRAISDLKLQQKIAVKEGDLEQYDALQEKQKELELDRRVEVEELQVQQESGVHPELQSWIGRNAWFETQPHMRVFADQVAGSYKAKVASGQMTPAEVLKEVEKAVRQEFPTKFRNPNKDKPSAVEGGSGTKAPASARSDNYALTDDERKVMQTFIRSGVMTKEQYIADLKALKAKG